VTVQAKNISADGVEKISFVIKALKTAEPKVFADCAK